MWRVILFCFCVSPALVIPDATSIYLFPFFNHRIILSEVVPILDDGETLKPPAHVDNRIVGGEPANIEDHPYQVSIIVNNSYFCGGFIIGEQLIMSAAHCSQDVDPSTALVRAGSSYRKNGTVIPIAAVIPHPEYDKPPFDKDVAIWMTKEKIEFTDTIQPIPLAPKGRPLKGDIIVSGWGRTQQGASSIPERLMAVKLRVVNFYQCFIVYPTVLTREMWCAGNFFLGGKGTCQGDSGGAAIQDGMIVGVVSFGRGCGQALSPSVFADVTSDSNRRFIDETIKSLTENHESI